MSWTRLGSSVSVIEIGEPLHSGLGTAALQVRAMGENAEGKIRGQLFQ